MLGNGLKKRLAVLLTGVMVLGMTVTAFAGETSGTQSSQGSGNFEGHVNKQIVDVTLPTVSTNYSPFSFVYDGEGLIKDTTHAAYGDDVNFGAATSNVYFRTGDKTYSDKSTKFTVSNNSSVSVNIALQVDVTPGAKDPVLLSSNTLPTGDDAKASIYLGLIVTGDADAKNGDKADTYVVSENMIKKTFCVAGMPENYTVSANKATDDSYPHTYTFKKDLTKTNWKKIEFQLEGAANKVKNAAGSTAPNLKVTWSFEPTDTLEEESGSGSGSGGSTTPSVVNISGAYVSGADYWYYELTLPSGTVLEGESDITNLKVDGNAIASGFYLNSGKNKVRVPRADVKTALGDAWATAEQFTFTFTANDVNYSAADVSKN